jgi:hypothetical protein
MLVRFKRGLDIKLVISSINNLFILIIKFIIDSDNGNRTKTIL